VVGSIRAVVVVPTWLPVVTLHPAAVILVSFWALWIVRGLVVAPTPAASVLLWVLLVALPVAGSLLIPIMHMVGGVPIAVIAITLPILDPFNLYGVGSHCVAIGIQHRSCHKESPGAWGGDRGH
jgi:hypothetical protein